MDKRPRLTGPLIIVVALAIAGCGTDDSAGQTTSSTSTSSRPVTTGTSTRSTEPPSTATTTSTTGVPAASDAEVLAAYVAAMDAYASAVADPPNPDHPVLAELVADPLLTEFRNVAAKWKGFGQAARYPDPSVHRTELISAEVTDGRAVLEVCSVDDSILYEPATGRVLNDDVSTNRIRATLVLEGDRWLLSERERIEQWEGVAGCAV